MSDRDRYAGREKSRRGSPLDAVRAPAPPGAPACTGELRLALHAGRRPPTPSKLERCAIACFVAGLHGRPEMESLLRIRPSPPPVRRRPCRPAIGGGRGGGPGRRSLWPLSQRAAQRPRTRPVPSIASPSRRVDAPGTPARGGVRAYAYGWCSIRAIQRRPTCRRLLDAGWSTTGIVVISQLVAFLSYQIRVVAGLRVLNARPRMTDKVLSPPRPMSSPSSSPATSSTGCPGSSRWPKQDLTPPRHMAGPGRCPRAPKSPYFPPCWRAIPKCSRAPHPHRQGHLLQSGGRPAAGPSVSLARRRDPSRYNGCIYCASVACPVRRDLFRSTAGRA